VMSSLGKEKNEELKNLLKELRSQVLNLIGSSPS